MELVFARFRGNNSQNDSPYNSTADAVSRISVKRQFHSFILRPPNGATAELRAEGPSVLAPIRCVRVERGVGGAFRASNENF
jgi:hypothetical protein